MSKKKLDGPRVLFVDIETAPLVVYTFQTRDANIANNQIIEDTYILSWAAKWMGDSDSKIMYMDQRKNGRTKGEDKKLLKGIWNLLDQADIVVGQNSKAFDVKKLNTAFLYVGLGEPSSFKQIDTYQIAKRRFAFTSNKLEFTSDKLNKKYKKLSHGKFPGLVLWKECMAGNLQAWKEMEKYNKHDVFATEEYWGVIAPWDNTAPNFSMYHNGYHHVCVCGSTEFNKNGYKDLYTTGGRYRRYKCKSCGKECRGSENLLSKEKRDSLKRNTSR